MTDRADSSRPPDDLRAEIADEFRTLLAQGRHVDPAELARAHGMPVSEVERLLSAVRALENLEGVDLVFEDSTARERETSPPAAFAPEGYEILGELGRGGMGIVYRARQISLNRTVALKVLRPGELLFGDSIRRFQNEARHLAKLRHPHIVPVHEVGESDGAVWFTMDLIEGRPLTAEIRGRPPTAARTTRILRQVASAVAYVHQHGLIHRDLKPGNILLDERDEAYVTDFGLAREISGDSGLTLTGQVLGTPAYMSPEQARGDTARIGESTDVYALGAILYECLTGRPPFRGPSPAEILHQVLHADPRRPSRLNPKCPHDLEVICLKALEKDPARRYPTAQAFLEDLERFEAGRAIQARPPSLVYRAARTLRRVRVPLFAAAASAAVLFALFFWKVAPRLGQNPEIMMDLAASLESKGEAAAALQLYAQVEDGDSAPFEPYEVADRANRCRLALARGHLDGGRLEQAAAHLAKALASGRAAHGISMTVSRSAGHFSSRRRQSSPWAEEQEVLTLLAVATHARQPEDADRHLAEAFEVTPSSRMARRRIPSSFDVWSPDGHAFHVIASVLTMIRPFLLDRAHPARLGAVWILRNVIDSGPDAMTAAATWLRSVAGESEPVLAAALEALGRGERAPADAVRIIDAFTGIGSVEVLAGVAGDRRRRATERGLAALWLRRSADLAPSTAEEPLSSEEDWEALADSVLTVWNGVKGLPRADRETRLIRNALDLVSAIDGPEQEQLSAWLSRHTGFDPYRIQAGSLAPSSWKEWSRTPAAAGPPWDLPAALGFEQIPGLESVPALIGKVVRTGRPEVEWAHRLLHHLLPQVDDLPEAVGSNFGHDLADSWRCAIAGDLTGLAARFDAEGPRGMEIAMARFHSGAWDLDAVTTVDVVGTGRQVVSTTPPLHIRWDFSLPVASEVRPGRLDGSWRLPVIESRTGAARAAGGSFDVSVSCQASGKSLAQVLNGWHETGSGSSHGLEFTWTRAGAVVASIEPGGCELGTSGETTLLLLRLVPEEGTRVIPSIGSWRSALSGDFEAISRAVDAIAEEWRRTITLEMLMPTLRSQAELAGWLGLPDAIESLKRMERSCREAGMEIAGLLRLARLAAGDVAALDRPEPGSPDESSSTPFVNVSDALIAHVRCAAEDDRIRGLLLDSLGGRSLGREAGRILRSAQDRGMPIPGNLARQVAALPDDKGWLRSLPESSWALAVLTLVLLTCMVANAAKLLRSGRHPQRILGPAAILVIAGLCIVAVDVRFGAYDLLWDPLGYTAAAIGSAVLARWGTGPFRHVPAMAFGCAAPVALVITRGWGPEWFLTVEALATFAGIAALPALAAGLLGYRPEPSAERRAWIAIAVVAGGLLLCALPAIIPGFGPAAKPILVPAFGALLLGIGLCDVAARRQSRSHHEDASPAMSWRFLWLHVLPLALFQGALIARDTASAWRRSVVDRPIPDAARVFLAIGAIWAILRLYPLARRAARAPLASP